MPKVTITFNLPDEKYEHECAIRGSIWKSIVYDLSIFLRTKLKHGHEYRSVDEALEDVRRELWDLCNQESLDPWSD